MSIAHILEELPKLNPDDRRAVWQRLSELEADDEITPSPELLAAIKVGIHSAETEPRYTIEAARQKLEQCARQSK